MEQEIRLLGGDAARDSEGEQLAARRKVVVVLLFGLEPRHNFPAFSILILLFAYSRHSICLLKL